MGERKISETPLTDEQIQERDKEIFEAIIRAYNFELEQKDKINTKLNNFISILGTIVTLNVGIGFFVLDMVSVQNPFFNHLIVTLFIGIVLFGTAISIALRAYKPSIYHITPSDPKRFIEKYANLTKTHVVRETAMTMADIVELNRKVNLKKVEKLNQIFWLAILGIIAVIFFTIFMILALRVPLPIDP